MKIYLVEKDNGQSYEDRYTWIESGFISFRRASQYLLDQGFRPYPILNSENEYVVCFEWYESDEYMADCEFAYIKEMELNEEQ